MTVLKTPLCILLLTVVHKFQSERGVHMHPLHPPPPPSYGPESDVQAVVLSHDEQIDHNAHTYPVVYKLFQCQVPVL